MMLALKSTNPVPSQPTQFGFLRLQDVLAIEDALQQIGAFGEIHLIVEQGRLGYIRTLKSEPLGGTTLLSKKSHPLP